MNEWVRGSHLGWDLGRMVLQYEPLQVQDPHAFVLLGLGLEAETGSTHTTVIDAKLKVGVFRRSEMPNS